MSIGTAHGIPRLTRPLRTLVVGLVAALACMTLGPGAAKAAGKGQYTITSTTIDESALAASSDSIYISGEGDAYYLFLEAVDVLAEAAILE